MFSAKVHPNSGARRGYGSSNGSSRLACAASFSLLPRSRRVAGIGLVTGVFRGGVHGCTRARSVRDVQRQVVLLTKTRHGARQRVEVDQGSRPHEADRAQDDGRPRVSEEVRGEAAAVSSGGPSTQNGGDDSKTLLNWHWTAQLCNSQLVNTIHPEPEIHEQIYMTKGYGTLCTTTSTFSPMWSALWTIV